MTETFEFYLFSLSKHRDDGQQWEEYGRAGEGFSIGFATSLFQLDKDDVSEIANENLHVGRVVYGEEPTEERHRRAIERAAQITSEVGNPNIELIRRVGIVPYLRTMTDELIASQLIWNCLTAKNDRFRNECEVRCVILNLRKRFDNLRQSYRGKNYIEVSLPLKRVNGIVEIIVGAKASADAEVKVRDCLRTNGYADNIPVIRSELHDQV